MARNRWWGTLPKLAGASAMLAAAWLSLLSLRTAHADETEAERQARIQKMSNEEKSALLGKKARFDDLDPAEKQRLYDLHAAITHDPAARQLEETVRHYNKWLADLSPTHRSVIVQIADPKDRIARIKDLMRKQEEDRFRLYVQEEVPRADQDAIYSWIEEFVLKNEPKIMERLRGDWRARIESSPDEAARRRSLVTHWQFARRDPEMPVPSKADFEQLHGKLSEDVRKRIDAKVEDRERRLADLMWGTLASRAAQPSRDELHRFYMSMAKDDPRRERLLELEQRDEIFKELQRMYNDERWGRRGRGGGGFRGGPGGFGGPDGGGGFGGGKGGPPPGGRGGEPKGPPPDRSGRGNEPPPPPMP